MIKIVIEVSEDTSVLTLDDKTATNSKEMLMASATYVLLQHLFQDGNLEKHSEMLEDLIPINDVEAFAMALTLRKMMREVQSDARKN